MTRETWRLDDDKIYFLNKDMLEGLEFNATLRLATPLSVLKHHGEIFRGPPSEAPVYGTPADGIWIYKTKSWGRLGTDLPDHETAHATDIEAQYPHEYLPFLVKFREAVESHEADIVKAQLFLRLKHTSDKSQDIWNKLELNYRDFPRCFLFSKLTVLNGVTRTIASKLYDAGFISPEQVLLATESELAEIPGIGKATVKKIFSSLA